MRPKNIAILALVAMLAAGCDKPTAAKPQPDTRVVRCAVIGGMTAASFVAIFLIPVTYYMVEKLSGGKPVPATPPGGIPPTGGALQGEH